ncbi:MAG: ATP-binding protein [Pseudomonadota bacterium]
MTFSVSKDRLGLRLVILSLLVGSVLSVFSTGIQLLTSFERQKQDTTNSLDEIEAALTETLERALWTFDFAQVDIILDGIATNEAVTYLQLVSPTGHSWTRGQTRQSPLKREYSLNHSDPDMPEQLVGTLTVELSLQSVIDRVWAQFWVTLLTNLAKAYLAALALLVIVHRLITRHLRAIGQHIETSNETAAGPHLRLQRPARTHPDDLDRIVQAITRFEDRVRDTMRSLRSEIGERIKSEKEAREALSVRASFISTMSHEVRTPLNSIMGFLHLISVDAALPDKQRRYAEMATKAAQGLHNQLSNILEMSRLDSKAVDISTRPTDIRRLAGQWRDNTEAVVHLLKKDIEVRLDIDPTLDAQYIMDGARVTQIVTNLTDNATKFTAQGAIRISVRALPDDCDGTTERKVIAISVADTGPGIDPAHRHRIFDRFAQIETGMDRTHDGAGLGLAICQELADLMGATLNVAEDEKDGYATEFLLTLSCNARLDT